MHAAVLFYFALSLHFPLSILVHHWCSTHIWTQIQAYDHICKKSYKELSISMLNAYSYMSCLTLMNNRYINMCMRYDPYLTLTFKSDKHRPL